MSENPWDKNFKIPKAKRKAEETPNSDIYNGGNSIAANSYYEYYNQFTQEQWQQSTAYPQHYYAQPGGSSLTNSVEPITRNIFNTLSSIKEKPKNYQKNVFRDTVPDINDPTLPKELTSQFQPLFCKLCKSQLSSNVMAKLHYKSKNHEKKVRKFLVDYSVKTGTPLHKRAKVIPVLKDDQEADPKWFHCDVCDLPLTGRLHAESHYMGKNHQKVVMGYKMPAGRGHYNNDGTWIRESSTKKATLADGEDTFGQDFKKKKTDIGVAAMPSIEAPPPTNQGQKKFQCSVCNVATTCQEQLDIHFQGQKHFKKLRQLGVCSPKERFATPSRADSEFDPEINLSVYRTPSGEYYCPTCNITLTSGMQFKLHVRGKQHLKKNSQKHS